MKWATAQMPAPNAATVNIRRPIWSGESRGRLGAMVRRRRRRHIWGDCMGMGAFGTVLIVVCVVAVIVAALSFRGSGKIYRGLGRTGVLTMDDDNSSAATRGAPPSANSAEA